MICEDASCERTMKELVNTFSQRSENLCAHPTLHAYVALPCHKAWGMIPDVCLCVSAFRCLRARASVMRVKVASSTSVAATRNTQVTPGGQLTFTNIRNSSYLAWQLGSREAR
eukprot:6205386-Pleurochrysis_carterae.AAC.2